MEKVLCVLETFQEVTRIGSCDNSTIGLTLPLIRIVKKSLEVSDADVGISTLKRSMARDINNRYPLGVEWNPIYAVATVLDPRFKTSLFLSNEARASAISHLEDEVQTVLDISQANVVRAVPEQENNPNPVCSGGKKRKVQDILDVLMELPSTQPEVGTAVTAAKIVNDYLAEPTMKFTLGNTDDYVNVFNYWKRYVDDHKSAAALGQVARKHLGAPPTSVASEKMFSSTGIICSPHRCRLRPEKVDMLLF
jgi:hypothetical protein